jgi:hypothetical protein
MVMNAKDSKTIGKITIHTVANTGKYSKIVASKKVQVNKPNNPIDKFYS